MTFSKRAFSLIFSFSLISSCTLIQSVQAIQPLSSKELKELCENYQTKPNISESMQCMRYIKGFIDGAIAADSGVAANATKEAQKSTSFSERAIDTRVGNRIKKYNISVKSDFCLGEPLHIAEIINKVTSELSAHPKSDKLALTVIYEVLKKNYPCK